MNTVKDIVRHYVDINDDDEFFIVENDIYYDITTFQNFLQRTSKITIPKFYSKVVRDDKELCRKSHQLCLLDCKEQWFLTKNREILEIMEDNFYTSVIGLNRGNGGGHMIMMIHDNYNNYHIVDSSGASILYENFEQELTRFLGEYRYCENAVFLQRTESQVELEENEPAGYCIAWSHFLAVCCHNVDLTIDEIIEQIFKETSSDPLTLRKLIRGFTYSVFIS